MNSIITSTPMPYRMVDELPLTGHNGQLVLLTTEVALYVWLNDQWNAIGSGSAAVDGVILSESGDYIITESGDYIAFE